MGVSENASVEKGGNYLFLPIVPDRENPGIGDIELSRQCYGMPSQRHPVRFYVDGRGIFLDLVEVYVEDISEDSEMGSLHLMGQICDLNEGRFFEVEVFYTPHDEFSKQTGHMRVCMPREGDVVSEDPHALFARVLAGTLG